MKKIRNNIFETNSSSSHSISLNSNASYTDMPTNVNGIITIGEHGDTEFGWGYYEYNDADTKLNYLVLSFPERIGEIKNLVETITKCEVKNTLHSDWSLDSGTYGYIDHQSNDTLEHLSTEEWKDFLFNPKSVLIIDNDNH